jgi:pyridoxamine 5'-phosphate oxidase
MDLANPQPEEPALGLCEAELLPDPIEQFQQWFAVANAAVSRAEAVTLATATPDGQPSARIVLVKDVGPGGFVFFTNYHSRKGQELLVNPRAALVFYWAPLDRQVRVEGTIEVLPKSESDAYFATRPWGSRLSASASPQSQVVPNRDFLENRVRKLQEKFAGGTIPRPDNWGGYRLVPTCVEFWQGQENRLHDRLCYRRRPDGTWHVVRLAP